MVTVRPMAAAEWPALVEILAQSFNFPAAGWDSFRARLGDDNFRVACDGARIVGGCGIYRMGQVWMGRSVPLAGLAGVGVAPDMRGKGVARTMMTSVLRELRASGAPMAGLYPASWQVYRAAGYDLAGERVQWELPLPALAGFRAELPVVPVDPASPEATAAFASRYRPAHGNLDRSPAIWDRLAKPHVGSRYGWLIGNDAYVILGHTPADAPHWDIEVFDLHAPTAAAGRTILSLLGGHRSLSDKVRWYGSPADALVTLLPEPQVTVAQCQRWMLRIVDFPAALAGRGWPRGMAGELHVDVDDPLLVEHAGAWVITVSDGRAVVRPGGRGELKLTSRSLGPLYSGYLSATALVAAGLASGPDAALELADALFAAPTPWMREMY